MYKATCDNAFLVEQVEKTVMAAILKRLKIARLREVITIEHVRGAGEHEYADYLNIRETFSNGDAIDKAEELGSGIAVLYNALLQDALMVTGQKVVSDLFLNNLQINFVVNNTPSVADPMCVIPGWISFRFWFRSSNELPKEVRITGHQETLAKAKKEQNY